MPAKSKAQMRYLFAAASRGEVPKSVAEDFAVSAKKFARLPQHVRTKKAAHHATDDERKHSDE